MLTICYAKLVAVYTFYAFVNILDPKDQLTKFFDLLIMTLFLYGIEIWGAAYQGKYLDRIDKFFKRAFRFGYTNNLYAIAEVIRNRDCKLWNTITDTPSHPLYQLLPLRKRDFCETENMILFYLLLKQNALRDLLLIGDPKQGLNRVAGDIRMT